jgi:hypothetical protein
LASLPVFEKHPKPAAGVSPGYVALRAHDLADTTFQAVLVSYLKPVALPAIHLGRATVYARTRLASLAYFGVFQNQMRVFVNLVLQQIKLVYKTLVHGFSSARN